MNFNSHHLKNAANSVDYIYSCYFLHKRTKEDILKVLFEWKRVIRKGQLIRISVPDFFLLSDKYLKSKCKIEEVNRVLDGSKIHLDFVLMQKLLLQAGFYAVKRFDIDKYPPEVEDESSYRINGEIISLNVEAYG
jgi:predicted SAM-dependent methyltransferase